jgi:hypothetical protein
MGSNTVNSKKQPDRVSSIRMRQHEFKCLGETLRSFGVQKNGLSARVKVLFSRDLHRSRRYARSLKELKKKSSSATPLFFLYSNHT